MLTVLNNSSSDPVLSNLSQLVNSVILERPNITPHLQWIHALKKLDFTLEAARYQNLNIFHMFPDKFFKLQSQVYYKSV